MTAAAELFWAAVCRAAIEGGDDMRTALGLEFYAPPSSPSAGWKVTIGSGPRLCCLDGLDWYAVALRAFQLGVVTAEEFRAVTSLDE